ncbi:guanylate kinase, partial [bacterium]|nr:guanylate kinase [bacterium]
EFPDLRFSVSHTTRSPRPTEVNGREYHFVDEETFHEMVRIGAFAEWARVHDHYYGTSLQEIELARTRARGVLFDIDHQGARQIRAKLPEAVSVFILPPSLKELERRLRGRGTDADEVIATRLRNARWEVGYAEHYRYWLVNDDVAAAADRFRAILTAEACRRERAANPLPPTSAQT